MTQLYVLSQSGDSAVNLGRFEYVYVGDDNKIKAVCGQRVIRLGDYDSRDSAKVRPFHDAVLRRQESGRWLVSDDEQREGKRSCCSCP